MNPVKHVAIIMDGNGRWGVKHKQSRNAGHRAGLNTVDLIINHCINHRIEFLTLYTFSSENWKRPKNEINFLFKLLENFLRKKINEIIKKNIKLKFIGELSNLPTKLQKLIKLSEKKTFNKKTLQVNIALNYGSKIELINTIKKIKQKKITINEKNIDNNLYTKHLPNPDILIRTGDTHRLSNFLLWQLSYTEIFFEKKLWPDFTVKDFNKKMLQVNIALNYGSKIELINAIKKIKQKKITINEKNIDNNLYTKRLPNPDILIRTGNTHRLSNFLLWQLSYTEIFFEKKLWPDFSGKDFDKIMNKFKKIKRNFGSI